jgi:diguanylate cyclase (GGDEF)-like protein
VELDGLEQRTDDRSFQATIQEALALAADRTGLGRWALARWNGSGVATQIASYGTVEAEGLPTGTAPGAADGQPTVRLPVAGLDGRPLAVLSGFGNHPVPAAVDADDPLLATVVHLIGALLARQLWWTLTARHTVLPPPEESLRDPVTGIGNRRWWDRELGAEERRCQCYGSRAGVVLIDLVGTTRFNTTYGRSAGDLRLRETARLLASQVRRFDRVARVGADEFAILLVETGVEEVEPIVDRLTRAMDAAALPATTTWAVRDGGVSLRAAWTAAEARLRRPPAPHPPKPSAAVPAAAPPHPGGLTGDDTDVAMQQALDLVRRRIGGDVAFIAEFADGLQTLRWISAGTPVAGLHPGVSVPVEGTYCQRMLDGRLPNVIADTAANPVTRELPVTQRLGIGSYLGVPLALPGGRQGTLCCVSHTSDPTLNDRDASYLTDAAELITATLGSASNAQRRRHEVLHRLDTLRDTGGPNIVVQPIVDLVTGQVVGVEALSRFPTGLGGSPLQWFLDAAEVGQMVTLEMMALRNATSLVTDPDGFVSVNLSPTAVMTPGVLDVLSELPLEHIVLELTEHEQVDDLTDVATALAPLRASGLRIAIDDVGSGYAGLTRVAYLRPDILKLDIGLVRDIHRDAIRQALAAAFVAFATDCGALVIAEGIETPAELITLRALGAHLGQGWTLSRPVSPDAVPRHIRVP